MARGKSLFSPEQVWPCAEGSQNDECQQLPVLLAVWCWFALAATPCFSAEAVAVRVESLVVNPAQIPSVVVVVGNRGSTPYEGRICLEPPEGWIVAPSRWPFPCRPARPAGCDLPSSAARIREDNLYSLSVTAVGSGATITHRQDVAVASAPYFKPEVDGLFEDWKDAIPVSWMTQGKKTSVRTFWNRRQFAFLVAVEEDHLQRFEGLADSAKPDAVQVALSPEGTVTPAAPDAKVTRYEFVLLAGEGDGMGRCLQLAAPGMKLSDLQKPRDVGSLPPCDDARLFVRRDAGVTYYECALPITAMREHIPPGEGREFCFAMLVHDPDGTGLRDWGQAAGLWPWDRSRAAWSNWGPAAWGPDPPFDSTTAWGMCSSKY